MADRLIGIEYMYRHGDLVDRFSPDTNKPVVTLLGVQAADYADEQLEYGLYKASEIAAAEYGVQLIPGTGIARINRFNVSPSLRALVPTVRAISMIMARSGGADIVDAPRSTDHAGGTTSYDILTRLDHLNEQNKILEEELYQAFYHNPGGQLLDFASIITQQRSNIDALIETMLIKENSATELRIIPDRRLFDVAGNTMLKIGMDRATYEAMVDATPLKQSAVLQLIDSVTDTDRFFRKKYAETGGNFIPFAVSGCHGGVVVGRNAIISAMNSADIRSLYGLTYGQLKEKYGPSYGNGSGRLVAYFESGRREVREVVIVPTASQKDRGEHKAPPISELTTLLRPFRAKNAAIAPSYRRSDTH